MANSYCCGIGSSGGLCPSLAGYVAGRDPGAGHPRSRVLVLAILSAVWATRSPWPDIAVGALIGAVFVRSAFLVARDARAELRSNHAQRPVAGEARDGDPRASYAVIEDGRVTLRRAAYDIERTIADLRKLRLEDDVTSRLVTILRDGAG
jgi:hypothetical protein